MSEKRGGGKIKKGYAFIVGAGPGDPGLITVRGLEAVKKADIIIYDRLASPRLLSYKKPGARLVFVGKEAANHAMPQEEINRLIADEAAAGNVVCRLKGGDPYIFGRGGEEALLLAERGIPFEVVPGISAFASVPAYAGIPVTHRGYTSTAAIVTGHEDPTKEASDIDWPKVAGIGTLVFFMGIKNLPEIVKNLIKYGKSPATPAAVIQWGTTARQRTVTATLETIHETVVASGIKPPALFMVGETIELRDRLNWFESRPLFGRRIVVTRAREQASDMVGSLLELGADVCEFPVIKITEPDDKYASLEKALAAIASYDMVVFTSANGVIRFLERLAKSGLDARCLFGRKIAAIGEKTAAELAKHYIGVDIVPTEFRAEALVERINAAFAGQKLKILIARAQEAREVLPEKLAEAGHSVDIAFVYKMVRETEYDDDVAGIIRDGDVDMVTFASSGTVENFVETIGYDRIEAWLRNAGPAAKNGSNGNGRGRVKFAVIGPVTADTCKKYSIPVDIMPEKYTIDELVDAITAYYAS